VSCCLTWLDYRLHHDWFDVSYYAVNGLVLSCGCCLRIKRAVGRRVIAAALLVHQDWVLH